MAFGSGLMGGIAGGATVAIVIKGIDNFSGTFNKASGGINALSGAFKASAGIIAGAGVALAGIGVASIKVASDLRTNQIAFETMMGSAEEAKKMLSDLSDFALKTPFNIPEVRTNAKQLMAMGFAAKDIIPTMKAVGDVAAGTGADFSRLVLNLGQVQTQGKLTGRELRDFLVNGVPLIDALAEHFGVAKEQIQDMVSAGKVSSEDVIATFVEMSSEGGKFANLMETISEEPAGQFSNIQDAVYRLGEELGTTLLPIVSKLANVMLNDVLPAIEPIIPLLSDLLIQAIGAIIPLLPPLIEAFKFLAVNIMPVAVQIFTRLTDLLITKFWPIIEPLVPVLMDLAMVLFDAGMKILEALLPAIEALVPVIVQFVEAIIPLLPQLTELAVLIVTIGADLLIKLAPIMLKIIEAFVKFSPVLETVIGWVIQLVDWIGQLIDFVTDLAEALAKIGIGALNEVAGFVGGLFGGNIENVNDFILRPDGTLIKTDPQDTIIGFKNPDQSFGGGNGISIHIENIYGMDPDDIARELRFQLGALI